MMIDENVHTKYYAIKLSVDEVHLCNLVRFLSKYGIESRLDMLNNVIFLLDRKDYIKVKQYLRGDVI